MIQITFYTYVMPLDNRYLNKDKQYIQGVPPLEKISETTGYIKEMESIINPVFVLNTVSDFDRINYIYATSLNRYYFVVDKQLNTDGTISYICTEDLLFSWKNEIQELYVYVLRQEKLYNDYYIDKTLPVRSNVWIETEKIGTLGNGTGNCFILNVLNNVLKV